MWNRIKNTFYTATSFLQTGVAPPNPPIRYKEDLSKINFFSSKKFFIVFSSIVLLMFFYLTSVGILFLTSFSPTITEPYVTIFVESIKIFAIIISVYLGLQASIDFKYNSSSSQSYETTKSIEEIDEKVIIEETIKYQEIYKKDPSYAPLDWVMSYE
jgi:hypothetical protein